MPLEDVFNISTEVFNDSPFIIQNSKKNEEYAEINVISGQKL